MRKLLLPALLLLIPISAYGVLGRTITYSGSVTLGSSYSAVGQSSLIASEMVGLKNLRLVNGTNIDIICLLSSDAPLVAPSTTSAAVKGKQFSVLASERLEADGLLQGSKNLWCRSTSGAISSGLIRFLAW